MIKVKSFYIIFRFWWIVFWKYSVYNIFRFCAFLDVWKNLIHLIWNYVSILVLFNAWLKFFLLLKWLILFLNWLLIFFTFYNLCWFFQTLIITFDLKIDFFVILWIPMTSSFVLYFFLRLGLNVKIFGLQNYGILILFIRFPLIGIFEFFKSDRWSYRFHCYLINFFFFCLRWWRKEF